MEQSARQPDPAFELSLVRGDLLFRVQRRIGLIPRGGLGLGRRAVFWSLVAWLPIALWAGYAGRALPGETAEPLLAHFGIHARFLVAVPLLILAEGPAHALASWLLPYFVQSGVVPQGELAKFRAVIAATAKLRDATLPWIVMVGVVVAFATTSEIVHHSHEIDWAEGDGAGRWGFGALWYLYVGRFIFLTLVLGWLWRLVLVFLLLWRIGRLDLSIVPTHPDRTGGLGFLQRLPMIFAPVALAIGVVLASQWAHDAVYHGLVLQSTRVEMVAFVVLALVVFLLPLAAFAGPLKRAKKQALLDYGALVGRHGRLVGERWIEGKTLADDALLNAPELGPVVDIAAAYDAVKAMRTLPIGKSAIVPIAAAAAAPMLAVLAIQVPVGELLLKLLKALV